MGWRSVPLPFAKDIIVEVPEAASPGSVGEEWFVHDVNSRNSLPDDVGFASAFPHKFEVNPVDIPPYTAKDKMARRVKDLAIALCYGEAPDSAQRCPAAEVVVTEHKTKLGKAYAADVAIHHQRGMSGVTKRPAFLIVLERAGKPFEGVVLRSLRGEIRNRLAMRLGLPLEKEVPLSGQPFLPPAEAPKNIPGAKP